MKLPSERTGFVMMAVGLVIVGLSMAWSAHGHTMNAQECHTLAWDAKQAANDRPVATQKMQLAVMASTLTMCRERMPITCIYQDDADDTQAIGILNRMYEQMELTPKQIHDQVESECNERLMESVRAMHGGSNELLDEQRKAR